MTHLGLVCRQAFLAVFDRCFSLLPQRSSRFSAGLRDFDRSEPFRSVQWHYCHFYGQFWESERMPRSSSQAVITAYTRFRFFKRHSCKFVIQYPQCGSINCNTSCMATCLTTTTTFSTLNANRSTAMLSLIILYSTSLKLSVPSMRVETLQPVLVPSRLFKKNARSCCFFTKLCSPKNVETTTNRLPERGRSFRCFPHTLLSRETLCVRQNWLSDRFLPHILG
jgi:hypothetical protein